MSNATPTAFEKLLEYIKQSRGVDLFGYKPASLERRITQRMKSLGVEQFESYRDYLAADPSEFARLFDTILINVTAFFRDPEVWEYLDNAVLPQMLTAGGAAAPIRVWSAGAASGEEVYSIAILLAEHLGLEAFQQRVKIYATDIDSDALAKARSGCYRPQELETVPQRLRERYFESSGERCRVHPDLRRAVVFGRHNLIEDAPISHVDLLLCRNLFMYFNTETQAQVLTRLHFALKPQGYLILGKSEVLLDHTRLFTPLDLSQRVFSKAVPLIGLNRPSVFADRPTEAGGDSPASALTGIHSAALEVHPSAQIVLDSNGTLALANAQARALFGLSLHDIGRPIQDLRLSSHPVNLHALIEQARRTKTPIEFKDVFWAPGLPERRFFDVWGVALYASSNQPIGVSLTFSDASASQDLQRQLEQAQRELAIALEDLENANEELLTTQEELHSTIEGLKAANEELLASSQELETMNEELQGTNQELELLNSEVTTRGGEVARAWACLNAVLANLHNCVVIVNRNAEVETWNPEAEAVWGLRRDEALGQTLDHLKTGMPAARLRRVIQSILAGEKETDRFWIEATGRHGQTVQLRGLATSFIQGDEEIAGVVLIFDPDPELSPNSDTPH